MYSILSMNYTKDGRHKALSLKRALHVEFYGIFLIKFINLDYKTVVRTRCRDKNGFYTARAIKLTCKSGDTTSKADLFRTQN